MVGYSGTPLPNKIGVKEGSSVAIVLANGVGPSSFEIVATVAPDGSNVDILLAFVTHENELRHDLAGWSSQIVRDGMIWICWPKKSARKVVPSDITEDLLRDVVLPLGLVDVKVCAIDDVWSGLKFVWRKELRGKE
jgi:hypothetical protein